MIDNKKNTDKENQVKQDKSEDGNKTDLEKKNKTSQSKTSHSKPKTEDTEKSKDSKKVVTPKKRTTKRTGTTMRKRTKTTESKSKTKVEKKDTGVKRRTVAQKKIEESKESEVKEKEFASKDKIGGYTSKEKESNYQISLVDENLLSIKVTTEKAISVDCSVKDKKSLPSGSGETQSNKILIHPKSNLQQQEIEIVVTINPKTEKVAVEDKKEDEVAEKTEASSLLFPNPEVADLIERKDTENKIEEDIPLTPDQILQEKLGRKNPYKIFRRLYQRNLLRGMVGALILYFITVFAFYGVTSKESSKYTNNEQRRLIVIQDLPEPKIKLENVEDPNKPEEVTDGSNVELRKLPPPKRNFKKRNITRPYKNPTKTDTNLTSTNDELDSLRRLNAGNLLDSLGLDSNLAYIIPDSIKQNFSEGDIGLRMYFPNNWKLIDEREVDKNQTEFTGVVLADTTAKDEGAMNLFIHLDKDGKEFRIDKFRTEFKMEDTTLTAYSREPIIEGGFIKYSYYIFTKTDKFIVNAEIKKQYNDQYKNVMEAVVRSIKVEKASSL
ncbi:MAG: hypothetical protein H8D45_10435 [Bacteroidetes bacterium]|nr:hypothetical protein [Bacteroidota bacterium]